MTELATTSPFLKMLLAALTMLGSLLGGNHTNVTPDDHDRLQGTWNLIRAEWDAKTRDYRGPSEEYIFHGDQFLHRIHGCGVMELGGTFHLTACAQPQEIDLVYDGNEGRHGVVKAIYSFDGKTLKLCFAKDGTRPTSLTPGNGKTVLTLVKIA